MNNSTQPPTLHYKRIIILIMITTGAAVTVANKAQNKYLIYEACYYRYFFHPYMQSLALFFGEIFVLVVFWGSKKYFADEYRAREQVGLQEGKRLDMNVLLYAIPAFIDCLCTTLNLMALNFVPASVYQMLRGGTIATTFLFSVTLLKARIQRKKILGSFLAIAGIMIVGSSNFLARQPQYSRGNEFIGYILLSVSLFTNGLYFVAEQLLLDKYHIEPMEMVGKQGAFAFVFYLIVVVVISYIPCSLGPGICVFNSQGFSHLQQPLEYLNQLFSIKLLFLFALIGVVALVIFNITGVMITKYIDALTRSICDVSRTIMIWVCGIVVTLTMGSQYPNYNWQTIKYNIVLIQLAGFVLLIFGNLIFHGIINFKGLREKLGLLNLRERFGFKRRKQNKISTLIQTSTENQFEYSRT